jgi:predicted transcriptional regulator
MYYNVFIVMQIKEYIMGMMSIRLPDDLTKQLDLLANATGRSKSFLAGQAIRDYIDRESWQIAEITQAIHEADNGEFAGDDEVNSLSAKWKRNAG